MKDRPKSTRQPSLPRLARLILSQIAAPGLREELEGDILELYSRRAGRQGTSKARWRLYWDIFSTARLRNGSPQPSGPPLKPSGDPIMTNFLQDLRYALRRLAKSPAFALVAILTLALGMGANTAMYSIINGVLLQPLPYLAPEGLVIVHTQWKDFGFGSTNPHEYFDLLEKTEAFQSVALYRSTSVNLLDGDGEPERVLGVRTTPSLLESLGVRPALGRALAPGEEFAGAHRVALISDRLFKRRFGGDPSVLGRKLRILNDSYEVVGVMPAGFAFPSRRTDIWTGYGIDRTNLASRGAHSSGVLARIADGKSLETVQAELDSLSAQLRRDFPRNYPEASNFRLFAEPLTENLTGSVRPALFVLMGAVGFVLLIACANVANLLLSRITSQEKEFAIRTALGARAGRLVRQILSETFLLSLLGGLAALLVARIAFEGLLVLHPQSVPRLSEVKLDGSVLMFNIALVAFATLAAGLIPALRLSRIDSQQKLKDGTRSSGGRLNSRTRTVLVVSQITLATVLLMGAGLLLRSFQHLIAADPGFRTLQVATARVTLPRDRYSDLAARGRFYRQVIEQVEARPGVISAAAINLLPMGGSTSDFSIRAEGYTPANPDIPDFVQYRIVTSRYFETLGIPIRRGRPFNERDGSDGQLVAILSESLAKKFWGDQDPIGKRINNGSESKPNWLTVVGVVGEVHHSGSRQGNIPIWYQPITQDCWSDMSLAVRSAGDPTLAIGSLKAALAEIDPFLPLYNIRLMPQLVAEVLSQDRFNANLLLAFAGLALGLAAIGIFGVISYSVSQRTQEIGIRMALGAHRERILGQIMREGLSMILIGLVAGLAGALLLTRFMQALLFGVAPSDPVTFVSIAVVLVASGVAACLGPARRATRVDPMIALRYE